MKGSRFQFQGQNIKKDQGSHSAQKLNENANREVGDYLAILKPPSSTSVAAAGCLNSRGCDLQIEDEE